jgi:phosphatidylglycerophosphatase A
MAVPSRTAWPEHASFAPGSGAARPGPIMNRAALLLATAGYVGFFPIAPGTAGSAAGLAVYALIRAAHNPSAEIAAIVVTLVIGIWSAGVVERTLGKDPGPVVIDEVLGMLVTLALLNPSLAGALVGFFLFRVFDVLKPFPAGHLERLHGGSGIMLDDAMAGIYANLVLRALIAVAPRIFG